MMAAAPSPSAAATTTAVLAADAVLPRQPTQSIGVLMPAETPTEEATAAGAEEVPEEAPSERVAKRQAGAEALVVGRLRGDAKDHHAKRSRTCPASSTMRLPFCPQVRPVAAPVPLARRTDANARPDQMRAASEGGLRASGSTRVEQHAGNWATGPELAPVEWGGI